MNSALTARIANANTVFRRMLSGPGPPRTGDLLRRTRPGLPARPGTSAMASIAGPIASSSQSCLLYSSEEKKSELRSPMTRLTEPARGLSINRLPSRSNRLIAFRLQASRPRITASKRPRPITPVSAQRLEVGVVGDLLGVDDEVGSAQQSGLDEEVVDRRGGEVPGAHPSDRVGLDHPPADRPDVLTPVASLLDWVTRSLSRPPGRRTRSTSRRCRRPAGSAR